MRAEYEVIEMYTHSFIQRQQRLKTVRAKFICKMYFCCSIYAAICGHVELLHYVIEPVTFARSAGPGGTIHIYMYMYWRIVQHGTASVGLAQARPKYVILL